MRVFCVFLFGLLLTACDTSGHINVAPSAHHLEDRIRAAADQLNEEAGDLVFTVELVNSEDRINNQIVLRSAPRGDGEDVGGHTSLRVFGSVINIAPDAPTRAIAHELCHGKGLKHVNDTRNLMTDQYVPNDWTLTKDQLDQLRGGVEIVAE